MCFVKDCYGNEFCLLVALEATRGYLSQRKMFIKQTKIEMNFGLSFKKVSKDRSQT